MSAVHGTNGTMAVHGGQDGRQATARTASDMERCSLYEVLPRQKEPWATMKSRMAGEAAKEEKTAWPRRRTTKESGKAVKEKFKTLATQKRLIRGNRFAGLTQNGVSLLVPPTELATME
jgi:hypothetical protein